MLTSSHLSGSEAESDEAEDYHGESCSPVAGQVESPFIYRNGLKRLRRTVAVIIEEGRTNQLVRQHRDQLLGCYGGTSLF